MKRVITRRKFFEKGSQISLATWLTMRSLKLKATTNQLPYVITVHCDGGWDPTMVFDDKTSVASVDKESGATKKTIADTSLTFIDHPDRPSVNDFFSTYGSISTIVNGIYTGSLSHEDARRYMSASKESGSSRWVDWLTYFAAERSGSKAIPHIAIDAPYFPGSYSRFSTMISSSTIEQLRNGSTLNEADENALKEYMKWSYDKMLDNRITGTIDSQKLQTFYAHFNWEAELKQAANQFSFNENDSEFLRSAGLALHLFKEGKTQCASLQYGKDRAWDDHSNLFAKQSLLFEGLFSDLKVLMNQAKSLGIDQNLFIIVKSDMGRTAKLTNGTKAHWPYTSSLLIGQNFNGGKVFGATNDLLVGKAIDPIFATIESGETVTLTMEHLVAALFQLWGQSFSDLYGEDFPAATFLIAQSTSSEEQEDE